jgi:FMN phosphatase YigB (HAD superfamily)
MVIRRNATDAQGKKLPCPPFRLVIEHLSSVLGLDLGAQGESLMREGFLSTIDRAASIDKTEIESWISILQREEYGNLATSLPKGVAEWLLAMIELFRSSLAQSTSGNLATTESLAEDVGAALNLVWDIGGVLLRWEPAGIVEDYWQHTKDKFDANLDSAVVTAALRRACASPTWKSLDRGTLDVEAAVDELCRDGGVCASLDSSIVRSFLTEFVKYMYPLEPGLDLLRRCFANRRGGKFLVLSNFHEAAFQSVVAQHAFFQEIFDGFTVSSHVHANKPEPEIYRSLLAEHNLKPGRCVFIDDREDNVAAARDLGMIGILCDRHDNVEAELRKLGLI